jgi:hypothetical protein
LTHIDKKPQHQQGVGFELQITLQCKHFLKFIDIYCQLWIFIDKSQATKAQGMETTELKYGSVTMYP